MPKWSKKEREEILSRPFEIFPAQTEDMIRKGIPRGPLPWQRPCFIHLYPFAQRLSNPKLHTHHTTFDIAFGGSGGGKSSVGAALGKWYLTTFPGCEIIVGAAKYKDVEKNIIEKYYKKAFSIKQDWDHPWVKKIPNEHNKKLELSIEVEPGVFRTSTANFMHFDDWERLRGQETAFIHFDEISQAKNADGFEELTRRLRSPFAPFRQFFATTNPPESLSHWIYDKWDFTSYITDYEGETPEPKLCTCQFCQECLNAKLGQFVYDENGLCTNPNCAYMDRLILINQGLEPNEQIPISPSPRPMAKLPYEDAAWACGGNQNAWRIFMSNANDNHGLPSELMQTLTQSHDQAKLDLYVMGAPNSLGANKAYHSYSMNNIINDVEADPEKDIHWTHDFNVKPQASVIVQLMEREIDGRDEITPRAIDEIVLDSYVDDKGRTKRGAGPEHVAQEFINRYNRWNIEGGKKKWVLLHGDHTCLNNKQSPASPNNFQVIVSMLEEAGFNVLCTIVKPPKGSNMKIQVNERDRVICTNWMLRDNKGNRRLEICRKLIHLRKSLEDIEIDKSTSKLLKKVVDDAAAASTDLGKCLLQSHSSDALGYLLARKWNLVKDETGLINFVYVQGYKLLNIDRDDVSKINLEDHKPDEPPSIHNTIPQPGSILDWLKNSNSDFDDDVNNFRGYFM